MTLTFSWALWVFSALALFVAKEVRWEAKRRRLPASVVWVGPRDEVFSMFRAWIREIIGGLKTIEEGYAKYNTKGKPFAVLDTAGRSQVILPREQLRWLANQTEDIFSSREVHRTKFAVKYLSPPMSMKIDDQFVLAVRRDLTRNLGRTQKTTFDLLRLNLDAIIEQNETSWHEINLASMIKPAITSATYCVLIGQNLSADKNFLTTFEMFHNYLGVAAVVIGQYVPYYLTAPLGCLASIVVGFYRRRVLRYLVPEVQARMDAIQLAKSDPALDYQPPADLIQWGIGTCKNASPKDISEAVLSLALAAVHTTSITFTSALIDILSSPPELGYFNAIYDEAFSVFRTEEDWGKLASLHKLTRIDSALRESMRLNPVFGRIAMQEVIHKSGVTLPDGSHLPQGQWLGVSLKGITLDERFYSDPHKYDPWRFSRAREELKTLGSDGNKPFDNDIPNNKPNGGYLSTSDDRLAAFGYGKHACPGRWFASHVMKLTFAYIALHYEIAPLPVRPQNMVVGDCIVPPRNLSVRIRRRSVVV